jgi:putative oxidoreductase
MLIAFLIGRLVFGGYLLFSGLNHFMSHGTMAQYAAAKGVPAADAAIVVSGLLLLLAGVSFVLGWRPTWGIAATVVFLIPVTWMMHNFWAVSGAERVGEMVNFMKNIALLGATLMFAAIPQPWPYSVEAPSTRRIPA